MVKGVAQGDRKVTYLGKFKKVELVKYIDTVHGNEFGSEAAVKAYLQRKQDELDFATARDEYYQDIKKRQKECPKLWIEVRKEKAQIEKDREVYINSHSKVREIKDLISQSNLIIKKQELAIKMCRASLKNYEAEVSKEFTKKEKVRINKIAATNRRINYLYSLGDDMEKKVRKLMEEKKKKQEKVNKTK